MKANTPTFHVSPLDLIYVQTKIACKQGKLSLKKLNYVKFQGRVEE